MGEVRIVEGWNEAAITVGFRRQATDVAIRRYFDEGNVSRTFSWNLVISIIIGERGWVLTLSSVLATSVSGGRIRWPEVSGYMAFVGGYLI